MSNLTAAERKQPLLIGIGHKARVGKDTFAWMLVDALRTSGIDARRYGFADALKAVCRVEYGMAGKDATLLQRVGVDYREGYRAHRRDGRILTHEFPPETTHTPNIWVDTLLDTIAEDTPQVAIIADTRFRNEVEAITSAGGLYIRIDRPAPPESGRDNTHISEVDLDGVPASLVVKNDKGLGHLRDHADRIAATVFKKVIEA